MCGTNFCMFFFFKKLLFHYRNFGYMLQRSLCEGKLFKFGLQNRMHQGFFNRMAKWTIFVLNRLSRVWRPSRHIYTQTFIECASRGGGGRLTKRSITVTPTNLHLQHRPWELPHLHACKLRAIWRIYTQNAREKQACKIRQSLNYTQYHVFIIEKFPLHYCHIQAAFIL